MNQRRLDQRLPMTTTMCLVLIMVLATVLIAPGGITRSALAADGGPAAKRVYGQPNFTSNAADTDTLYRPYTMAVDSSGGVYVGDGADRVLYYPAGSTTATRTYSFLNSVPKGVAVDDTGVYVAVNYEVLFFAGANTTTPARRYTSYPDGRPLGSVRAVAVDSTGVYVADYDGHSVLFYPGTSTAAERWYGHDTYAADPCNPGRRRTVLCSPTDIAIGPDGIWVVNITRHTTIFYPGTSTTPGGDVTTSWDSSNSFTSFSFPWGVAADRTGGVYVAEGAKNRVVYYARGSSVPTHVYGQPDLNTTTCNTSGAGSAPTASTLCNPYDVAVDASGNVYVVDGGNNRALVFNPPTGIRGIRITDASVTEGNTGTSNATFTVRLSSASTQVVTVNYATANGTAKAGLDYTTTSGTLTFPAGTTTPQTITVPVLGDTLDELNESFFVNLTNPSNAVTLDAQGLGRILDDDLPAIRINNIAVVEGNTGTSNATFTVALSSASTQVVTVNYATANGTAKAGLDYTTTSGTLSFPAGTTRQTITVPVLGDTLDELKESFFVNLTNLLNATSGDMQGLGLITDDDPPVMRITNAEVAEGNTGTSNATFTVALSSASTQVVTVNYATANGTAKAGLDYTTTSGTLSFPAGTTRQTITVPVLGDTLVEGREAFIVNLTSPLNATPGRMSGSGYINNDD